MPLFHKLCLYGFHLTSNNHISIQTCPLWRPELLPIWHFLRNLCNQLYDSKTDWCYLEYITLGKSSKTKTAFFRSGWPNGGVTPLPLAWLKAFVKILGIFQTFFVIFFWCQNLFQVIYNHNQRYWIFLADQTRGVNPFGRPDRKKAVLVFGDFP